MPATAAPPTTWPAGRQILYILDVSASVSRGSLLLDLMVRDRKKNGEWSKPKIQGIASSLVATLPDAHDQRILTVLHGAGQVGPYGYWGTNGYGVHQFAISGLLQDELLPALAATGRLRSAREQRSQRAARSDLGRRAALGVHARCRTRRFGQAICRHRLAAPRRRAASARPSRRCWCPASPSGRTASRSFVDHGAFGWVKLLCREGPMLVPLRDKDKLLTELLSLPVLPRLELPEDLSFEEVAVPPRPRLVVKPSTAGWRRDQLEARLSFVYGEQTVPAQPRQRGTYDAASRRFLLRDLQGEQAAEEQLAAAGVKPQPSNGYGRHEDGYELSPAPHGPRRA